MARPVCISTLSAPRHSGRTLVSMRVATTSAWLHHPISTEGILRWWFLKRAICWRDYLFAGLLAYLLPFLALGVEWCLTWHNQLSLVRYFGLPNLGNILGWMGIPALVSFLVFLPLLRYPVRCRVAAIFVCLTWIVVLLSGEAAVH
jgi:hypothetical protein